MTRSKWDGKEEEDRGDLNHEYIDVDTDMFHKRKRIRRIRRVNENARIIGGGEATRNRYPYIASITYERGKFDQSSLLLYTRLMSFTAIQGVTKFQF